MSDLFDDFNKIFKKDLVPIIVKFLKDPNNNITDNLNQLLNDPQRIITDLLDGFIKNKDNENKPGDFTDIANVSEIDQLHDDDYENLFKHLIVIEDNMIQLEKILKDKN